MYSIIFSNSATVACFFKEFAFQLMIFTLPLTYPFLGIILSRVGDPSMVLPCPCSIGIPNTGQVSGMTISSTSILNGTDCLLALCRADFHIVFFYIIELRY